MHSDDSETSDIKPQSEGQDKRAASIEEEREILLKSALAGDEDTLDKRVAIVLNHYPETRDSDIKLQLRYWTEFESYDGGLINPADLFAWARLTSLTRARAKIQNTYRLFQASREIRQRRGKLSEEERQKALDDTPRYPTFAVYVDESGKTGSHLILAGIWFGVAEETLRVTRRLAEWRNKVGFQGELHFKELDESRMALYQDALGLVLNEAGSVSFKAMSVAREGIGRVDQAIEEMLYHFLVEGVQHENDTGRAPLPRSLQVWKDLEERGRDTLLMATLKDRVLQAGHHRFGGQLDVDEFEAVDSSRFDLMQIADLYAGSLNRLLNGSSGNSPKDRFARYFLESVGMPDGPTSERRVGDLTIHVKL